MGKPVNADLPEGIYTLPVIRAAARDRDLARLLRSTMTRAEAARAREFVIASGAVDEARAVADSFIDQADGQLAALSADLSARRAMTAYARSVLDRRTPQPAVPAPATRPSTAADYALPQELARWVRNWMADTGLVLSPADFDRHHRWAGALRFQAARILAPANASCEQATAGLAMLSFVWDDLFEDPQLTDPAAVTALRHGLVAMLRQAPEMPGAIPAAWANLWPRLREGRTARWQERLLDSLRGWFEAAEREAHHRIDGHIPAVADYLPLRRSTIGIDLVLAGLEVYQGRELPSRLRNYPAIRRLEDLAFLVAAAENDLVGVDQDEADNVLYNLVRVIRHETGCTRGEAVEQVQRQLDEHRAQLDAVVRYVPALLRMVPGLSGQWKECASIYANMTDMVSWVNRTDRYTPASSSATPDLDRLRREIYRATAESVPTVL